MQKTIVKKCAHCGKEFRSSLDHQRFCGASCRKVNQRCLRQKDKKKTKTCPICGKQFDTYKNNEIYCSNLCKGYKYQPRAFEERECIICGKIFTPFKADLRGDAKVCSKQCRDQLRKQRVRLAQQKKLQKRKQEIKNCKWCGKTMKPTKGFLNFCNNECCHEYRVFLNTNREQEKKFVSISEIDLRSRKIREKFGNKVISTWLTPGFSQKLRKVILERDGYMCYICTRQTGLDVHHIIPRRKGGPHIPENLITLCRHCHKVIDGGDIEKAMLKCAKRAIIEVEERIQSETS